MCLSIAGLAQCGGKDSLSNDVEYSPIPDDPIVINADFSYNDSLTHEKVIVKGPWFLLGSKVNNKSKNDLVLVTIIAEITGTNYGAPAKTTITIDPNITCGNSASSRPYLAEIPAGAVFTGLNDSCDFTDISSSIQEKWYYSGLPATSNSAYEISLSSQGYFVDADGDPIERLQMTGYAMGR